MNERTITAFLSEQTSTEHRRLEEALMPILEGGPEGWRWYFERMFGVHAAIEPLLWLGAWCEELDAERRATKRDWLRRDLLRMESDVNGLPRMAVHDHPWSDAERWGMAWVLEGSSLGNRSLSSMAPSEYRESEFLRGYGEQTAESWRTFKAALDRAGAEGLPADEVAGSAVALFRRIGDWLA
jgi:heme oxygenase